MLYGISHQIITPISMLWICAVPISPSFPSPDIWGFAAMAFCCTFAYEVGRKIRAPEDEREEVDSYTKALGLRAAPLTALFFFVGAAGIPIWWLPQIGLQNGISTPLLIVNTVVLLLCVGACVLFIHSPQKKWAKSIEGGSALLTLWAYGWILYAVLAGREVIWM